MTEPLQGPDIACPAYNVFADRYGGEILRDPGDLQLVDGDLAMTRDLDLMLGDNSYDAMRRLLEDWRFKSPHLTLLFGLGQQMIKREGQVWQRLSAAEAAAMAAGCYRPMASPAYQEAWQAHYDEEGTAQSGRDVYPGCIVLMASYALGRFRDDIGCTSVDWKSSGPLFGGRSVGEILTASANGVRHQDEWLKTRTHTPQQLNSIQVLKDALGEPAATSVVYSAGRCEQVLDLLGQGRGFDGLTSSMFLFAHDIAQRCRGTRST
jgi:hypothetical protein